MSSFYHGDALELSIFGQSHSPAIGVTLSGLPAGFSIDMDELGAFLAEEPLARTHGRRREKRQTCRNFSRDLAGNTTRGAPLCAL